MSLRLKICGLTRLADARFAAGAGADFLGFIQYPKSPRYIEPKNVREIVDWLHGPEPVGVFVNETADAVNRAADEADFTYVQLHGHEPEHVVRAIERPVIKAVHVVHDASAEQLRQMMLPYADDVDYFLLDTHRTNLWGGTGESFNWRLARDLSDEFPLFLAGGLTADNLAEAVATMRPAGVDVSSSIESSPGIKDFDKMADFFDAFDALNASSEASI